MSELGYTRYMFIDGDLPGNGDDPSLPGHEAMMITNRNAQDAHILVNLYFEDKPPVKGLHLTVPAERVICTRMDLPICTRSPLASIPWSWSPIFRSAPAMAGLTAGLTSATTLPATARCKPCGASFSFPS